MKLTWYLKDWSSLDKDDLYEILALRINVFVIEQNCPYQDADGKDKKSSHLYALDEEGHCAAYLRLLPPGVSYDDCSIGRVVTAANTRGTGLGKELMRKAMDYYLTNGNPAIRISAQAHLQRFYEEFGFHKTNEEYLEDDIPHIEMLYKP